MMNAKQLYPIVGIAVLLAVGVSYMIFLAATWAQLQKHRATAYEKIDEILDRLAPTRGPVTDD